MIKLRRGHRRRVQKGRSGLIAAALPGQKRSVKYALAPVPQDYGPVV